LRRRRVSDGDDGRRRYSASRILPVHSQLHLRRWRTVVPAVHVEGVCVAGRLHIIPPLELAADPDLDDESAVIGVERLIPRENGIGTDELARKTSERSG